MRHDLSIVIGKFYPPHRGHKLLIDTALSESDRVVVIVCDRKGECIPGGQRARWIAEIHPRAEVMLIDDVYDQDDSAIWAANTIRWLGRVPSAVYTSEDYGPVYASLMGAEHVMVDRDRIEIPISGTQVRQDPLSNLDYLEPCVRAFYVHRYVVVGAESTGTTTVAEKLAERLDTIWVPEYGHEFCHNLDDVWSYEWSTRDFVDIATEQTRREDLAAREANRVLICDTDAWTTGLWHERYMGHRSFEVEAVRNPKKVMYFLTDPEGVPFVQDGTRDGEHIRLSMHERFIERLEQDGKPFIILKGSLEERLETALLEIEERLP